MSVAGGMHQTTVRFGSDLWVELEREAARLGVSVAHYVREAALARLAYTEGMQAGRAAAGFAWASPRAGRERADRMASEREDIMALRAQGELACARSAKLRQEAAAIRNRTPELRADAR
jgi:hypothetical protein